MAEETESAKRDRLLALAAGITKPLFYEMGTWIGGLEIAVATAAGTGVVNIQDCSDGSTLGPFRIPASLHKKIKAALTGGPKELSRLEQALVVDADADEDGDQDEGDPLAFYDIVQMVRDGYTPRTDYYVLKGENPIYGRDSDALSEDWYASLVDNVGDWRPWDDMETEELEDELMSFDVDTDPKQTPQRASRKMANPATPRKKAAKPRGRKTSGKRLRESKNGSREATTIRKSQVTSRAVRSTDTKRQARGGRRG